MRLFRKYKKAGNQYCIEILKRMEADKLPSIECAADAPYQLWTEMVDRGGLRQSSKEVSYTWYNTLTCDEYPFVPQSHTPGLPFNGGS